MKIFPVTAVKGGSDPSRKNGCLNFGLDFQKCMHLKSVNVKNMSLDQK